MTSSGVHSFAALPGLLPSAFPAAITVDGPGYAEDAEAAAASVQSALIGLESLTPGEDYIDGEGVFLSESEEEALKVAEEYGARLKSYSHNTAVIEFPDSTIETYERISNGVSVHKYAGPNYICSIQEEMLRPDDPYASPETSPDHYQYFHDRIHTLSANAISTGLGVKVAVLDTGCTPDHEDSKFDEAHCLHIASINSGTDSSIGHGIHCTGIIHETKNNSLGGYGVAPGAEVYSIRITDKRDFGVDAIIEGIEMAIELDVDVISISAGTYADDQNLKEVIDRAYESGITIVAAAGNECVNREIYPAAYENVISVGATDDQDKLAPYSNYGDWVDVLAPGSEIVSTYLFNKTATISGTSDTDSYGIQSGTSMAAPVVAGIAALIYGANKEFPGAETKAVPEAVISIIKNSTDNVEYFYNDHSLQGLIKADKAVTAAKDYELVKEPDPPYSFTDKTGMYGTSLQGLIARGKSLRIKIADPEGRADTKEIKRIAKTAVWNSSDPSLLSVKKGKVRCLKKAALGGKATVTASIGDWKLEYTFRVTEPIIGAGYTYILKYEDGKEKLKTKSPVPVEVNVGKSVNLSVPYKLFDDLSYVNLVYSKKRSRINNKTWGVPADDDYRYIISFPGKKLKDGSISLETTKSGRLTNAIFNKPGRYPVRFTPFDGSGKSFIFKIRAV